MFRRILIAVDGSEAAGWALDAGIDLARSLSHAASTGAQGAEARVGVVHVVDHCDASGLDDADLRDVRPDLPRALRRQGRQILRDARERIPAGVSGPGDGAGPAPGPCLLREGPAADEIVAAARDWHADLIVMGTHGRGRLTPLLVGATVEEAGFDERTTTAGVRDLIEAAAEIVPHTWTAGFSAARAGLRPATPDEIPVIGRSGILPNLVYATGHYRNGILLAPLTAQLVADVMLESKTDPILEATSPRRFGL